MTTLNQIISLRRLSQTSSTIPSFIPNNNNSNPSNLVTNSNNEIKLSDKLKHILIFLLLTLTFASLITTIIELARKIVHFNKKKSNYIYSINEISNLTEMKNKTKLEEDKYLVMRSFFASIWLFNFFLLIICLSINLFLYQQSSTHYRTKTAFLR